MSKDDCLRVRSLLAAIGLSSKEADVYLTLLKYGTRGSGFIAKKTKLSRSTAYFVANSLLEKDLLTKSSNKSIQKFTAQPPSHLMLFIKNKRIRLRAIEDEIGNSMQLFASLPIAKGEMEKGTKVS